MSGSHESSPPPQNYDEWAVDDSSFLSYVSLVNFREGSALELISRALDPALSNVGFDIAGGSSGRAITDLIETGFISKGAFATLTDRRSRMQDSDKVRFLAGDILKDDTWVGIRALQEEIAPEGFGIVLFRPYGALQDLESETYVEGARRVLEVMRKKGILYAQIPGSPYHTPDMAKLRLIGNAVKKLRDVEKLEVSDSSQTLSNYNFSLIYKR